MTERNLSIRLSVEDADKVRRELAQIGEQGSRALDGVAAGGAPVADALAGALLSAMALALWKVLPLIVQATP